MTEPRSHCFESEAMINFIYLNVCMQMQLAFTPIHISLSILFFFEDQKQIRKPVICQPMLILRKQRYHA